jgi:murein DD-endopeptidase MepM/ murein hydrolase activator NlpD
MAGAPQAGSGKAKHAAKGIGCGAAGCAAIGCATPLMAALAVVGLLVIGVISPPRPTCPVGARAAATATGVAVAGFTAEQLGNAATIIDTGHSMAAQGVTARDQQIAIMTAIQESGLRNLDHGDRDSLGLFQQRPSQGWGTRAQILDPVYASTQFYNHELKIAGRETMQPTQVAQAVQRSAFPNAYAAHWDAAAAIFNALAPQPGAGPPTCQAGGPGADEAVAASGWAKPGDGPVTSPFGMRVNPVTHIYILHAGIDLGGGGRGAPIYAAYPGVIIRVGFDSAGDGIIIVDHGTVDGHNLQTWYLHEDDPSAMAKVGQHVSAGQQIGQVGSSGRSTGPHLHYQVEIDSKPVDPAPFMLARGIDLNARVR